MEPQAEARPQTPVGLAIAIALIAFMSFFGLAKATFAREDLLSEFPSLTPALLDVMMVLVVAGLGCLVAIWFGRKWGAWIGLALLTLEFAIELGIGVPWMHLLRLPVAAALVASYVRPIWGRFR